MPGKLIHTNEVMVLLGENYFVERSAVQASEIVQRRLAGMCATSLSDLVHLRHVCRGYEKAHKHADLLGQSLGAQGLRRQIHQCK